MSLWMNDGGVVYKDGGLSYCPICPCDTGTGSTGTGTFIVCNLCKDFIATDEVELTIAGLTNNFCGSCASYNGTYVLPSTGPCSWGESWTSLIGSDPCNFGSLTATMSGTYVTPYLWIGLANNVLYRTFVASPFDCTSFNMAVGIWSITSIQCNFPFTVNIKSR